MASTKQTKKRSSASLHNHNCYAYLRYLLEQTPVSIVNKIGGFAPDLAQKLKVIKQQDGYNPQYPYADVYKLFFERVEDNITTLYDLKAERLAHKQRKILEPKSSYDPFVSAVEDLDRFINAIYANDNHILEHTYEAIKTLPQGIMSSAKAIEKSITEFLDDDDVNVNIASQTPRQAGRRWGLFKAMITENYKPQHTVSLATRRHYQYNQDVKPVEYRFGTQGQRHEGEARVSPLFEAWLEVQAREHPRRPDQSPINHVYINNLGFDRDGVLDYEGRKERELTDALHKLEERHDNIAVITLPADTGLMHRMDYAKTKKEHDYDSVFDEFLKIASQDKTAETEVKDFFISKKVRGLLFGDSDGYSLEKEKAILRQLLERSFDTMGIKQGEQLSTAQRQAVWFDFIKFELPNYIANTLNPSSINFSCKDAIDRGGVSSAYFNLMKSFTLGPAMTREEFDCALHAAPAMVKARGMNHHLNLIWNAVDTYIARSYDSINGDPDQRWLIEWRDANCPHERVPELLALRINQVEDKFAELELKQRFNSENPLLEKMQQNFLYIKDLYEKDVSGQRLLLDSLTLTAKIVDEPENRELVERYGQLADKLFMENPIYYVLAGAIKACCEWLLSKLGDDNSANKGIRTMNAGFEAGVRNELAINMKTVMQELKEEPEGDREESQNSVRL